MSTDQAVQKVEQLVKAQDARDYEPGMIRERLNSVYNAIGFLFFAGIIEQQDIEQFKEIDAAEYHLSVAYSDLIEGDHEGYAAAIAEAKAIVDRAEDNLKAIIERENQKNSI
jgi:hypothetical protein